MSLFNRRKRSCAKVMQRCALSSRSCNQLPSILITSLQINTTSCFVWIQVNEAPPMSSAAISGSLCMGMLALDTSSFHSFPAEHWIYPLQVEHAPDKYCKFSACTWLEVLKYVLLKEEWHLFVAVFSAHIFILWQFSDHIALYGTCWWTKTNDAASCLIGAIPAP